MTSNELSIHPVRVGALPLVDHYLHALQLESVFDRFVVKDTRDKIPVAKILSIILRNIILERYPLYKIGEWAVERSLLPYSQKDYMNDDRSGRALDRLFKSDRASMGATAVLKAIEAFNIVIDRIHNDSTTISLSGTYENYKDTKAAKPKRGINKDFRPDLLQLVYDLSATSDGAVPLLLKLWDGNTTDDTTHMSNWMALRTLIGRSTFVYVADSKLCVRETLMFIAAEGGSFVTVVPETRGEIKRFKDLIQTQAPLWSEASREPNARSKDGPPLIYWTYDSPFLSTEGFRIIWVKSSQKIADDEQRRFRRLEATDEALAAVAAKRFKSKDKLETAVLTILKKHSTENYYDWQVSKQTEEEYKQACRGRPDENTQYRKIEKSSYKVSWCQNAQKILYDARYDGIFPLITNLAQDKQSAANILKMYKFQPRLEKRFEQLKTVYNVAPVFLQNPHRIEALLFLYFLAMLITALIERTVRQSMNDEGLCSIPIYPEQRACKAPTADKILALFDDVRLQYIMHGEKVVQEVPDKLTDIQRQVLGLLKMKPAAFFSMSS